MLIFISGVFFGGLVGVVTMCIFSISKLNERN